MSDLKLFTLHVGIATLLPITTMTREKSLQTLIKGNFEIFLGVWR